MKIILKTKDETLLLQDWIDHHTGIVGAQDLLILDNMSTRREVLTIYEGHADSIPIGAFDGFVDNPHSRRRFSELYDWLAQTTDHYIFLDTYERLIWVEGDEYLSDYGLVERLQQHSNISALPRTWLYNRPG